MISSGPSDPNIDGGQPQFYRRAFNEIIVNPNDPNVLFASVTYSTMQTSQITNPWNTTPPTWNSAAGRGIFKGIRNPVTDVIAWTKVTGAGLDPVTLLPNQIGANIWVTDLEYTYSSAADDFYLFAGVWTGDDGTHTNTGIYRSIDLGHTWQPLDNAMSGVPLGNIGKVTLTANHIDENRTLYMAIGNNSDGILRDVFKSSDDGDTWTNYGKPGAIDTQSQAFLALGVSPTSGRVYVGGVISGTVGVGEYDPAASGGLGAWRTIVPGAANAIVPHTDSLAFTFYRPPGAPAGTDQVYAGNDGGFWRYNPGAAAIGTWTELNNSPAGTPIRSRLQTLQVDSVAISPRDGNHMIEAAWDNAFGKTTDAGRSGWRGLLRGDGVAVFYDANPNVNTAYFVSQYGEVWRYDNFNAPGETSRETACPAAAAFRSFL